MAANNNEIALIVWYNNPQKRLLQKYEFRTTLKRYPGADKGEQLTKVLFNYEVFRRRVKDGHVDPLEEHNLVMKEGGDDLFLRHDSIQDMKKLLELTKAKIEQQQ